MGTAQYPLAQRRPPPAAPLWPVYRRGIAEHFAQHLDGDPGKLSATLGRIADSARRQGV